MQSDFDKDLKSYFTDAEYLQEQFKQKLGAATLSKRLLVIHGVGGVGKSSLLRVFRLQCQAKQVPIALASGDEDKSALDVLARWSEDLKAGNLKLPTFSKTFEYYRAIQAKVDEQVKKAAGGRVAEIAGKAASKTAETAGGALAGALIGSVIPGVGTAIGGALGGVLGEMGAETLVDWLRGFLTQPDIDLLLDPTKKLTHDLLADLQHIAEKQRIVLMLDTFEQMTALEDWVNSLAQHLPPNGLFVIAGRALPDWSRHWPSWMAYAQVEELRPMAEEDMRTLVRRYYAKLRGGEPAPKQIEAIVRFARGLPMVVTSAVQLWVKYGVEDFQAVKPEIVANLVDRLMEGVSPAIMPVLEAAAIVRWFNQPILRAVTGLADVRDVYNELRRFPFIRVRVEGLAMHDAVREIIDENLRAQDPERHRELHERAAVYFEKQMAQATGEEAKHAGLGRLYHRIRANEEIGMKLFQEMAEELTRYRLVNSLRGLLNDVNTYRLEYENSKLWREYYQARLMHLDTQVGNAEKVYQAISENTVAEAKLSAYALCDLGELVGSPQRVHEPGGIQRVQKIIEQSLRHPQDSKLAGNYLNLGRAYARVGQDEQALENYHQILRYLLAQGDNLTAARIWVHIKGIYAYQGDWRQAREAHQRGLQLIPINADKSFSKSSLLGGWAIFEAWAGQYREAMSNLTQAKMIEQEVGLGLPEFANADRDWGFVRGMQECFEEAINSLEKSSAFAREKSWLWSEARASGFLGLVRLRQGELKQAEEKLQQALETQQTVIKAHREVPEVLSSLGLLSEVRFQQGQPAGERHFLDQAERYYRQTLDLSWTYRYYFECAALTGLVRVKQTQGDDAALPPLLAQAEKLAQKYEYNDQLASLRLTQGHLVWETKQWSDLLRYYQHALIYALRYNRFLLDELLSGRPRGTPLRPIISACLERSHQGKEILLALRDWWKTDANDVGMPRPDTLSHIPEGSRLVEAETMVREREPGDGSKQRTVLEQIEAVL